MSKPIDEDRLSQSLREGLQTQPVPRLSPDFNDQILASLRTPPPWWQRWWQPARPVVFSAAGSLVLTLLLLHWSMTLPITPFPSAPLPVAANTAPLPSLDVLLAHPDLCASALSYGALLPSPAPTPAAPPPPPPRRHAEAKVPAPLIA